MANRSDAFVHLVAEKLRASEEIYRVSSHCFPLQSALVMFQREPFVDVGNVIER
jgi:hypothetical protein